MSLDINIRVGETLVFNGGQISMTVLQKSGQRMAVRLDADSSVSIQRLPAGETATSGPAPRGQEKMLAGPV